ncbi:MAG: hypothetical protein CFE23_10515 [Flavobacterium sp. BFFFF1]|uniref:DUF6588 family protein n=1 Tax=Flavobacterium sp. BFFFF1 TaxID=2015557 RepID=UPI000BD5F0D0|nr:DUF6588 family protein [Flavobacterium sp. BFFFF1]OYU80147.1 MAG: hypothetical protein CFE23_10515 [Flavobacterium sp. BFFFF1]
MRRSVWVRSGIIAIFLSVCSASAQTEQTVQELNNLIDDAIFFTDKYITPATDAAVYQAASGWISTPKKSNLWDFTAGLYVNSFLVPESDRQFRLSNSDFSFFTIEGTDSALTPSALGNDAFVTLTGTLNDEPVVVKSPEGVNRETIIYPYIQTALGLWKGTEVIAKFSPQITLKHVNYQVYGVGVKHNLSQYFKGLDAHKFSIAALAAYSKEDITVEFLDVETAYGNLGFTALNSLIDTWQFQLNAAKEFARLELSAGLILNTSDFQYEIQGEKGAVEAIVPLHSIVNERLREIYKTKSNAIGELSARYQFRRFFLQTSVAFGKFVNSNISLQYKFK